MTAVTAKVECTSKSDQGWATVLSFQPDYKDGRNAEWAEATPSLVINMTVKTSVGEHFKQGGKYTLTFEPSDGE